MGRGGHMARGALPLPMEKDTRASDIIYCQYKGVPLLKAPSKYVREGIRGHQDCSEVGPTP